MKREYTTLVEDLAEAREVQRHVANREKLDDGRQLGFAAFRDGSGGTICRSLGLDISGLPTWEAFTTVAVRFNDRTGSDLVDAARKRGGACSSGERAVLCAALAAADFAWLADELTLTETWERFSRLDAHHRRAVAAAILRQDG